MIKILNNPILKSLFKNSSYLIIANLFSAGVGILSLYFMVSALGLEQFGIFTLVQTYALLVASLSSFQPWQAIVNFGSRYIENVQKLKSIVKLGLVLDILSAMVGFIFAIVCIKIGVHVFEWSDNVELLLLASTLFILFNVNGTFLGVLKLFLEYRLIAFRQFVVSLFKLILVFLGFYLKLDLLFFIFAWILPEIFGNLLLVWFGNYILRQKQLKGWLSEPIQKVKGFIKFAFWNNLTVTLDIPVKQIDVFIISILLSLEQVGIYKIFKQLLSVLVQLIDPVYQVLYPEFSARMAKNQYESSRQLALHVTKIILFVGTPVVFLTILTSSLWSPWFFSENSFILNSYVFYVFLIVNLIAMACIAIHPLFLAAGFVKSEFFVILVANLLYLFFAYILTLKFGLFGLVWAFAIQAGVVVGLKAVILLQHKQV